MMNFWKQRNLNNITEKPPHYRSKFDDGAVLLYLDFLTVLEGEADIVSAVSRSTPTQSQRNRISSKTVKWILSVLPFFLHVGTPICFCAIQRFHRAACAGTVQIWKGLGFPNKHFATQNSRCIYVCPACYNCVGSEKFTASERYRCPSLSYNEDVLRERCAACRLCILQFSPPQNASYFWLHTLPRIFLQTLLSLRSDSHDAIAS